MRWTSLMREKRNKTGRVVLGKPEGKRRLGRKVMLFIPLCSMSHISYALFCLTQHFINCN